MDNVKLSPPWITYVNELKALFGKDPDITIKFDEDENHIQLLVDNSEKADALTALLPAVKNFGNVELYISVVPENLDSSYATLVKNAFKNNPVISDVSTVQTPFGDITYAMFRKEVVQFYNDQMDDPNGNKSTLYQDIARDVFGGDLLNTHFCTDTK